MMLVEMATANIRTYHRLKSRCELENYVSINLAKNYRKTVAILRAEVILINTELLHCGSSNRLVEQRKCTICNEIVSECHVLTQCSIWWHQGKFVFHHIYRHVAQFNEIPDINNTCFILSNAYFSRIAAKTFYDSLERRKSAMYTSS